MRQSTASAPQPVIQPRNVPVLSYFDAVTDHEVQSLLMSTCNIMPIRPHTYLAAEETYSFHRPSNLLSLQSLSSKCHLSPVSERGNCVSVH